MKAIVMNQYGEADVMRIGEADLPQPRADEVQIRVKAAGINRADVLQRRGLYPPPEGASHLLGLEVSGEIVALGPEAKQFEIGQLVCALLAGGGYAEVVVVSEKAVFPLPDGVSVEEGAAIPEAFLTAYVNLFELGQLQARQQVLIHAGASGIGTAAIQLVKAAGAEAYVTAGSDEKVDLCRQLGAKASWNYRNGSFLPWIQQTCASGGVDLVLDMVGGSYASANLQALGRDGRYVLVGLVGGAKAEAFPLDQVLMKRLQIKATTIRSQTDVQKGQWISSFTARFASLFAAGELRPVIDEVFPAEAVAEAHRKMESGRHAGKLLLRF
ncbi:NAD(P)H-quinone oxidoreductase [Marinicrinis sediminis]|uniref:NAD(P)H-quinone oxidoreductase n=1 Tax=Marinicrinis sediminis TaxID=1652465 RepID=A0ABW5RBZ1_9BACL